MINQCAYGSQIYIQRVWCISQPLVKDPTFEKEEGKWGDVSCRNAQRRRCERIQGSDRH